MWPGGSAPGNPEWTAWDPACIVLSVRNPGPEGINLLVTLLPRGPTDRVRLGRSIVGIVYIFQIQTNTLQQYKRLVRQQKHRMREAYQQPTKVSPPTPYPAIDTPRRP